MIIVQKYMCVFGGGIWTFDREDHCQGQSVWDIYTDLHRKGKNNEKMDYYRPNMSVGGVIPTQNYHDTNTTILNSASDSYAPDFWSIPYTDGLSPMKQIEGKYCIISLWSIVELLAVEFQCVFHLLAFYN